MSTTVPIIVTVPPDRIPPRNQNRSEAQESVYNLMRRYIDDAEEDGTAISIRPADHIPQDPQS